MEPTRLTGQGIRDLNDRGPKKKPAPAEVPAPDTSGEAPIDAAAPEAHPVTGAPATGAPTEPVEASEATTAEHHG